MPKNVTYWLLCTSMLSSLLCATSMKKNVTGSAKVYVVMQSSLAPENPYQPDFESRHYVIDIPSMGYEYILDACEEHKTDAPLTRFFILLNRFCNPWNVKAKRD